MESRSSDTSLNLSERESSAWVQLWNSTYSQGGNFVIGEHGTAAADFTTALGDKAVAARAVAFVVGSTRKGIVSHCADIANLFRLKQSLEEKVMLLNNENEVLRRQLQETRNHSRTGSTVSQNKYQCTTEHHDVTQSISNVSRSNSVKLRHHHHCSSCNKITLVNQSNGNQEVNSLDSTSDVYDNQPGSPVSTVKSRDISIEVLNSCPTNPNNNDLSSTTTALVQVNYGTGCSSPTEVQGQPVSPDSVRDGAVESLSSSDHGSNRSLELFTSMSQECWQTLMQEQLHKTIKINSRLSEELQAARSTIEKLQKENTLLKSNQVYTPTSPRQNSSSDRLAATKSSFREPHRPISSILPSCQVCAEVQAMKLSGSSTHTPPRHDSTTFYLSDHQKVNLDDSVLTLNNRYGTVKYIGHLDGFSATCVFVGLQLPDKVTNGLDGTHNGKRYFDCPKGKGMFVQIQDIISLISRKNNPRKAKQLSSKKLQSSSSDELKLNDSTTNSPPSTSSSGSGSAGLVGKLRKAVTLRHTHSHKKITLPPNSSNSKLDSTDNREVISNSIISENAQLPNGLV